MRRLILCDSLAGGVGHPPGDGGRGFFSDVPAIPALAGRHAGWLHREQLKMRPQVNHRFWVTGLTSGGPPTFAVTGSVNNDPYPSGLTPDGAGFFGHATGAENGIANVTAPRIPDGMFLDNNQPSLTPAPSALRL